ncbi:hypothetical protein SDC9_104322 [bioreactor metagenome]|uniref:CRM domain-containing protein n=1 Tax=bioreactor metagenome TaxID=1076179 RepID=A0A645AWG7_9ZZZZ
MLTSKQRAQLRKMANGIDTIFQIGKGSIGDNLIRQVDDALEARELIKLRVLDNSLLGAGEAMSILCEKTGAQPVMSIGSRFVLYRESKDNKKIFFDSNLK